jgi:hypothetical protein
MTFTYRVALKAPGGTKYIMLPDASRLPNINLWLGANLHQRKWKHHLLYNDDPPGRESYSGGGHCKGVLVWDDTRVGWLVHSTPNWPAEFVDPLPPIDAAQTEFGQSFVYIEADINKLDIILAQLAVMGAHIYSSSDTNTKVPVASESHKFTELAYGLCWHVAKSPASHTDFYDTYLTNFLGGSLMCQTWGRPLMDSTERVKNIRRMQWAPDEPVYLTSQDHSKFAVSMDWRCPHVYIGDLNHMQSQEHRGGGGIVINNYALWQSFHDIIVDYSVVEPNKQKGQKHGVIARVWAYIRPYWAQCCQRPLQA